MKQQSRITWYLKLSLVALVCSVLTTLCFYVSIRFIQQSWVESTSQNLTVGVTGEWQVYSQPLFVATFPSPPTRASMTGQIAKSQGFIKNDIYTGHTTSTLFVVEVGEFLPEIDISNPDQILKKSADRIQSMPGVKIATSSILDWNGHRAMRMVYYDWEHSQFTKSLFIFWDGSKSKVPSRYYSLGELSKDGQYNDEEFDHFINSFKIID